ncbi:hypothetical protein [Streptomyces sp. NPDC015125]|uniref:hypothetical protein n=1 Tax=Streptomyces sp. NPDC015125 TaxID=3364938 RepID=UPI0036FFEC69
MGPEEKSDDAEAVHNRRAHGLLHDSKPRGPREPGSRGSDDVDVRAELPRGMLLISVSTLAGTGPLKALNSGGDVPSCGT